MSVDALKQFQECVLVHWKLMGVTIQEKHRENARTDLYSYPIGNQEQPFKLHSFVTRSHKTQIMRARKITQSRRYHSSLPPLFTGHKKLNK